MGTLTMRLVLETAAAAAAVPVIVCHPRSTLFFPGRWPMTPPVLPLS